jgi:hypothetical protein
MASAAACLSLSPSSFFAPPPPALSFVSFSSSLSPRLNGSLSVMGLGSTADSGCHLLAFPGAGVPSLAVVAFDALRASMSSTPSLKATRRPSCGFGEADFGGGL